MDLPAELLIKYDSWTSADWATVVSVIATAFLSLISLFLNIYTLYKDRKKTYIETITANRIKWLSNFKSLVSQFSAATKDLDNCYMLNYDLNLIANKVYQIYELKARIGLELNCTGIIEENIMIIIQATCDYLDDLNASREDKVVKKFGSACRLLLLYTNIYSKVEWNRINDECFFKAKNKYSFNKKFKEISEESNMKYKLDTLLKKSSIVLKTF